MTFVDPRDGEQYQVVRLQDGNIWFTEELRYETPNSQIYKDKTGQHDSGLGRYYSGLEVHQAAPPGWRIPNPYDWYNLYKVHGEFPKALIGSTIRCGGYLEPYDNDKYNYFNPGSTYYQTGFHTPVGFRQGISYGLFIRGLCPKSLLGQGDKSMSVIIMPNHSNCDGIFESVDRLYQTRCIKKA